MPRAFLIKKKRDVAACMTSLTETETADKARDEMDRSPDEDMEDEMTARSTLQKDLEDEDTASSDECECLFSLSLFVSVSLSLSLGRNG